METKQQQSGGDGLGNLAGMSKNQLYDIMTQMKTLIEQNEQQARQVLVDNPVLTKALFQAQIMLGMVQVNESNQQESSQPAQESAQQGQNPGVQAHSLSANAGIQEQANVPQTQFPARKQQTRPCLPSMPSASVSPGAVQVQSLPPHSLPSMQQPKGHPNMQGPPMALPSSSQSHSVPLAPLHSAPQPPPNFQPQLPPVTQQQQSLHSSGTHHLPPQPPFPPQPRPPLVQPFQHQHQHQHQHRSQMGPHQGGFQQQPHGPVHPHHSQPPFSSGMKIPGTMGPSFPQGQPPLPSQPPPHTMYQVGGGSHMGSDFNSQAGNSMQVDRPPWMPGLSDNPMGGNPFPGPPSLHGHMGPVSQPPRPPQMSQEAEKLILQQVMSLTPEQINLLPPEQALQVRQLQQLLRP